MSLFIFVLLVYKVLSLRLTGDWQKSFNPFTTKEYKGKSITLSSFPDLKLFPFSTV